MERLRLSVLGAEPGAVSGITPVDSAKLGHSSGVVYKGIDEPRNPFRGNSWVRPEGLVRAARKLKALDRFGL